MLVVVDTNVLLVSVLTGQNITGYIKQLLIKNSNHLNDIFTEYEGQIAIHWHPEVAANVMRSVIELSSSIRTIIYFHLNLIEQDADDNKFVDCAFAANADYIITNDSDFNALKQISFPAIKVVNIDEFKKILLKNKIIE